METTELLQDVEAVIQEDIRPQLAQHGGNIQVLSLEDGVLRFQLTGRCSGCPAASITTEELIRATLTQRIDQVRDVLLVERVNEDLVAQARAILTHHHL